MAIKDLWKQNRVKLSKILLWLLSIEASILLSIGIYNLIKDNSVIIASLIIFLVAYFIGGLKDIIFKTNLQKQAGSFKKKIVTGAMIFVFCILFSVFRKKILGMYFLEHQITILTIWFLIGVVLENIIVLIVLLRKEKANNHKFHC